jgi:hypothetical protein
MADPHQREKKRATAWMHILDASEPGTTLAEIAISFVGRKRRA